MRKFTLVLTGLALLLFGTGAAASAQGTEPVRLYPPDTQKFPAISTWLDVRDSMGASLTGLAPEQITLLENGKPVQLQDLRETQRGLQISIAINATPAMAVRNAEGRSRYESITEALQGWANQAPSGLGDDFSLFTNDGPQTAHLDSAEGWLQSFNAYQSDFRNATSSLDSLSRAIEQAGYGSAGVDPAEPGVRHALLWVTSPPEGSQLSLLPEFGKRAQEEEIHLFIWSVSTAAAFGGEGALALEQLAYETGGQFFAFSGEEPFPEIQSYLGPLRGMYRLTFASAATGSGEYSLVAEVQGPDGPLTSAPQTYTLEILPPNPMLVSPPARIVRTSPADSQDPLLDLAPLQQEIRALVEFPDGHSRPLAATRLYVDGRLAAENSGSPFNQFIWDLSGYTLSGQHMLKVEVIDNLGLSKQSLEIPVEVQVVIPPVDIWTRLSRGTPLMNWAAVLLAGVTLGLVILVGGRSRLRRRTAQKGKTVRRIPASKDPVTQPVRMSSDPGRAKQPLPAGWPDRLAWAKRNTQPSASAQLLCLGEDGEPLTKTPVLVGHSEITFGREPTQATCVLDDPSVEALHARLRQDETGAYILSDEGSVAGTWVNYAPISTGGIRLEHGDILHIGRVIFRFSLLKPPPALQPRIETYTDTL